MRFPHRFPPRLLCLVVAVLPFLSPPPSLPIGRVASVYFVWLAFVWGKCLNRLMIRAVRCVVYGASGIFACQSLRCEDEVDRASTTQSVVRLGAPEKKVCEAELLAEPDQRLCLSLPF